MLVDAVRALVAEVLAALPPGAATVTEEAAPSGGPDATVRITACPTRTGAVGFILEPDVATTVFVAVGEHSWTEAFLPEREWPELVPTVRRLIEAVVQGDVLERRWVRRGRVVGRRTSVRDGDRWRLLGGGPGHRPLRRGVGLTEERFLPWATAGG
ncbi:hypothetical protein [Modestobacter sp. NPDC013298]|uniref:hypothetical protein n=1 Tax=Modestobacter sp. NPDC013298 TaxID=3155464 RepID=UPI0033F9A52D